MGAILRLEGPSGQSLRIAVEGFERPGATNSEDANWLAAELTLRLGGFRGEFPLAIQTFELAPLKRGLERLLAGGSESLTFNTQEPAIDITIMGSARGSALISGSVHGAGSAVLTFEFETDQTYLARALKDIVVLTREFPAR